MKREGSEAELVRAFNRCFASREQARQEVGTSIEVSRVSGKYCHFQSTSPRAALKVRLSDAKEQQEHRQEHQRS